ncbi:MAG: adenylate cyclase [Crocinitomix sp.]|jgi:adenylate cyclase
MKGLVLLLLTIPFCGFTQNSENDQFKVDSLKDVIASAQNDTTIIKAWHSWSVLVQDSDPELHKNINLRIDSAATIYLNQDLTEKEKLFYTKSKADALSNIGRIYSNRGDYSLAIKYLSNSLKINEKMGNAYGIAFNLDRIARIYTVLGENDKALEYYWRAINIYESFNDKFSISNTYNNIGNVYYNQEIDDTAHYYYEQALSNAKENGNQLSIATSLINIANINNVTGNKTEAIEGYKECIAIQDEIGDKRGATISYINISDTYFDIKKYKLAVKFGKKALANSQELGDLYLLRASYKTVTNSYEKVGLYKDALETYKVFNKMNDSLESVENQKAVIRQQFEYEYEKQAVADSIKTTEEAKVQEALLSAEQATNKQQKQESYFLYAGLALTIMFGGFVFNLFRKTRKQKSIIEKEKARSEELLLNILPSAIAEELKEKGAADAQLLDFVTVLFTDFTGFTALSEILSPQNLVKEINVCFSAFDHIMEKHNVEKIKTIGDAYMAAGGLPTANETHAKDVVRAAIEIQKFMLNLAEEKKAKNAPFFEIRIGVHTGPVVAGIVGVKKFQYDIWGDTVNTASRMESSGTAGKVNISETTYEIVKNINEYSFESRGKIEAKGKGLLEMFYVENK